MNGRQARRISGPRPAQAAATQPGAVLVVVSEWTGGLASALRRARRDNIYDFAAYLGVGASTVDGWDKRPEVVPRTKVQKKLDQALEAAPRQVTQRFIELTRGSSQVSVSDSSAFDGNGADTNRNQALKVLLGLLGAAVVPPEVTERLWGARAGRVEAGLLGSHERLARSLRAEYLTGDARAVVPAALAQADDVLALWQRPASDRRRVEALVVGVNARAGLWAFFNGDFPAARKRLLTAWALAAASGDAELLAQALAASSVLYSALPSGGRGGDPEQAVELLDHANALAVHASPHTRLWVAGWHASEVIEAGDVRAARASVDAACRARQLVGDAPGPDAFFLYDPDQEVTHVRAMLSALDGRFADAEQGLDVVLRSTTSAQVQAVILAYVARVRARAGQPEGACEALVAGLDLAEPAGYLMGVERIIGVRDRCLKRWAGLSCVRALDERIGPRVL